MVDPGVRSAARTLAKQILTGEVSPYKGAAAIWAMLTKEPGDYPDDLKIFVGLASEWQDDPEHRDELAVDILDEARRFIDS